MSRYIPTLEDFPECECCGAPILRVGLCSVCAACFESVERPTEVSVRVIPASSITEPGDWKD